MLLGIMGKISLLYPSSDLRVMFKILFAAIAPRVCSQNIFLYLNLGGKQLRDRFSPTLTICFTTCCPLDMRTDAIKKPPINNMLISGKVRFINFLLIYCMLHSLRTSISIEIVSLHTRYMVCGIILYQRVISSLKQSNINNFISKQVNITDRISITVNEEYRGKPVHKIHTLLSRTRQE